MLEDIAVGAAAEAVRARVRAQPAIGGHVNIDGAHRTRSGLPVVTA